MIAYQTENNIYVSTVECQINPVREGWLLPAGAHWEAPPTDEPGKYRWNGSGWEDYVEKIEKVEEKPRDNHSLDIVRNITSKYLTKDEVAQLGKFCFDLLSRED